MDPNDAAAFGHVVAGTGHGPTPPITILQQPEVSPVASTPGVCSIEYRFQIEARRRMEVRWPNDGDAFDALRIVLTDPDRQVVLAQADTEGRTVSCGA